MFVRSLSFGVAAAALMVSGAQAADLIIPVTPEPIYQSNGFDWEGLYVGVQGGVDMFGGTTQGTVGGVVGVNFIIADPILLGVELNGNYVWGTGIAATEFLGIARIGAIVTDQVLVYADAGIGVYTNSPAPSQNEYQLGVGVEVAVTDSISVRGQLDAVGVWGGAGFNEAKATVGVFYHF